MSNITVQASKSKRAEVKITSPRGVAVWPRLDQPDTKFDENGIYSARLRIPQDEAKDLIAAIQKEAKAHMGKVLPARDNPCWAVEVDKETGEETGHYVFNIKAKNAMVRDKANPGQKKLWDKKPVVYDASGKVVTGLKIGGGSVLRVSFDVTRYDEPKKGLKLDLLAVQVIKLVEYGAAVESAEDAGFGVEEDGYVSPADSSAPRAAEADDDGIADDF